MFSVLNTNVKHCKNSFPYDEIRGFATPRRASTAPTVLHTLKKFRVGFLLIPWKTNAVGRVYRAGNGIGFCK